MLELPHPALATCGTTMPEVNIYAGDDETRPRYSNAQRTNRVRRHRWTAACVPQPVTFSAPNGEPFYHAIPANAPYEYKVGSETFDIPCNDPAVLCCDENVRYPKAPPVIGAALAHNVIMDDRKRGEREAYVQHWIDRNATNRLLNWKSSAPKIVLDVSLGELTANGRLKKAAMIAAAHERALHMQAHPDQYLLIKTSAIVKDRNGETLISVLGPDPVAVETLRRAPEMSNATEDEIIQNVRDMDMSHSPITPEVMDDLMQKTKMTLQAADYPPDSGTNSRHKPNNGQLPRHYGQYTLSDQFIERLREDQKKYVHRGHTPAHFETTRETATTCHWMHAWHQNGHRHTSSMTPSTDMWGNGRIGVGVRVQAYHTQTDLVRRILKEVAAHAMPPNDYARYGTYLSAYQAGNILPNVDGIFLGQVVVSNCYSYTHVDTLDGEDGWCLTFSSYGHEGAMMVFPELGVIVKYDPTDVCLFRSAELLHFVTDWEATKMQQGDVVTPGRTSFVFFTPSATLRELVGRPAGWFMSTAGGFFK